MSSSGSVSAWPVRITQALIKVFSPRNGIVFWNDDDAEFVTHLDQLDLPDVRVVRLDQVPALRAKILLETEADKGQWLIYSPAREPDPADDWLLDVRLRAKVFSADSASILLDDLGLTSRSMRTHIQLRQRFLRSKDRVDRLRRWVESTDEADELDRKMIAVVARAESPEPFAILLRVFSAMSAEGAGDLDVQPKALQEIASNELGEAFWRLIDREFAYNDPTPSLRGLLFSMLATDLVGSLRVTAPLQLAHFIINDRARAANVSVFLNRWRSDMENYSSYDRLTSIVAQELRVIDILHAIDAESLADVMTFEAVEKRIIADLKGRVISGQGANMDSVRALIARRRDGHWSNAMLLGANDSTRALSACYDALEAAACFLELKARHAAGFSFASAKSGFDDYKLEIYRFDQLYRLFMRAGEMVEPTGWAVLHELRDLVEDAYSGWFLSQLTSAWASVLEGKEGLLATWRIEGVLNQQDFYKKVVAPALADGAKRVFVIISDAFRYEAAEQLTRELNSKSRVKAQLDSMLGVLPSYTTLGMAALLPHQTLAYRANTNLDVAVDGHMTTTVEQRSDILARHNGVAVKRDALLELGKDRGREFVRPHSLIYIYHDLIDMTGDKQGSEAKTFQATEDAINELAGLVRFIMNGLNGSTIFITADHGFLYQESAVEESDRSALGDKPSGALKAKKRYILGRSLGQTAKAWTGNTEVTAGTVSGDGSMDFWAPKGTGRFHFAGGARFVHGSAMPQEVVVPVIAVKESESEKAKTRTVEVSLLGSSNRVVTNKQRFEFIQTEAVSERVLPVTVLVSLSDGNKAISDEQAVTFDSTSQLLEERKRSVMLTISAGNYDRSRDYFLVARDAKTKAEAVRAAFRVDLAFTNDF